MEEDSALSRPAILQLLRDPRVQDPAPKSQGSVPPQRIFDIGAADYPGDKAARTCDFGRIDYILPCRELTIRSTGVFWPPPTDPLNTLVSPLTPPATITSSGWMSVSRPTTDLQSHNRSPVVFRFRRRSR
jgi:hypothetical protein